VSDSVSKSVENCRKVSKSVKKGMRWGCIGVMGWGDVLGSWGEGLDVLGSRNVPKDVEPCQKVSKGVERRLRRCGDVLGSGGWGVGTSE
jgi:hypothetical protein